MIQLDDPTLIELDKQSIWHPCSQMKDYEQFKPAIVTGANGCYIELRHGKKLIDANSSWWCKALGHQHPRLREALLRQAQRFEHVIFSNTTYDVIVKLSQKLTSILPTLNKVFYASEGSSAVEIAMKLSLHSRLIQNEDTRKTRFIALQNGYHGETLGALSVSDLGIYCAPYKKIMFDVNFIKNIPYVSGMDDPLWYDCSEHWKIIEAELAQQAHTTTAIILEPILQAAGGMQIYSQDFLQRLRRWTQQHDIHLIADEIVTGLGRTGKMLACQHANVIPDFVCLAKCLTGGWLPLSAVLMKDEIYDIFYDDYENGNSFLHSHTYSGNALAASIALEFLTIIEEENICDMANQLGQQLLQAMHTVATMTQALTNIRQIGAVVAADLINPEQHSRLGYKVYQKAITLGALLRPIGNTIYWLPPLNMESNTLAELREITVQAIKLVS